MPLPGVTVVVKIPGVASSSIGTATNDKGEYEVSWIAQKDVALSFSFIGMVTQDATEELEAHIAAQLEQRSPFYEQAQHIINIDVLDSFSKVNFVVNEIQRCLGTTEEAVDLNC